MQLRRVTIVLLVVLLLGALVVPGAMAKKADKMVPLRGGFVGVVDLDTFVSVFSGNFSHLGRIDGESSPTGPGTAEAIWKAANGDEVHNTSVFVPGDPTGVEGEFYYTQSFIIDGGTGRFTCAEGFAEGSGTINFLTGEFDGYLEGEISQPNKCKEVPFKATLGGDFVRILAPDAKPCPSIDADFVTRFEGSGRASHLGRVTVVAQHCSMVTASGVDYEDGELTLTAANGDVLEAVYFDGTSELADPVGPVFGFIDTFEFVDGGTGRFTFASGGGTETGFFNQGTGEWSLVMEGTIAYDRK
jgi:hypothetical protein